MIERRLFKNKRIFVTIVAIIIVALVLSYIICKEYKDKIFKKWVGKYEFAVSFPYATEQNMHHSVAYEIIIYEYNAGYRADICNDGWMTGTNIRAQVKGDRNQIALFFQEVLPGDIHYESGYSLYDEGECLLSFSWEEGKLITTWYAMKVENPLLSDNVEGNVRGEYYEKVK